MAKAVKKKIQSVARGTTGAKAATKAKRGGPRVAKATAAKKAIKKPAKDARKAPAKRTKKVAAAAQSPSTAKTLSAPSAPSTPITHITGESLQTESVLKSVTRSLPAAIRAFAIEAARLVRDDKCEDVVVLDVTNQSQVTDYIVLGSGTSERQMRSVLQHVDELGSKQGFRAYRSHTDDRSAWLLLDFVDVVVHLFEPNTRAHYDLESLWPEANRIEWERTDQMSRDRAGLKPTRGAKRTESAEA